MTKSVPGAILRSGVMAPMQAGHLSLLSFVERGWLPEREQLMEHFLTRDCT